MTCTGWLYMYMCVIAGVHNDVYWMAVHVIAGVHNDVYWMAVHVNSRSA